MVRPSNDGGANPISPGALIVFKIAQGSNPLEKMGRIEDLAAEMRTAGLTFDVVRVVCCVLCVVFVG